MAVLSRFVSPFLHRTSASEFEASLFGQATLLNSDGEWISVQISLKGSKLSLLWDEDPTTGQELDLDAASITRNAEEITVVPKDGNKTVFKVQQTRSSLLSRSY